MQARDAAADAYTVHEVTNGVHVPAVHTKPLLLHVPPVEQAGRQTRSTGSGAPRVMHVMLAGQSAFVLHGAQIAGTNAVHSPRPTSHTDVPPPQVWCVWSHATHAAMSPRQIVGAVQSRVTHGPPSMPTSCGGGPASVALETQTPLRHISRAEHGCVMSHAA